MGTGEGKLLLFLPSIGEGWSKRDGDFGVTRIIHPLFP